jgi:GTP:adenosylcobinamide-phosphate guanylyltransferase
MVIILIFLILLLLFLLFNSQNEYFTNSKSHNIIILCGGPPKHLRNRHLEINKINNKVIITDVIEKCSIRNSKIHVIVNNKNNKLIEYLKKNHPAVKIILTYDITMLTTFKKAFSVKGDCILVCGDLLNIRENDINKFANTKIKSALCKYRKSWGEDKKKRKHTLKANVGGAIFKISENHKKIFLSEENINKAKKYFKIFYPDKKWDKNVGNHLYTWLIYTFFYEQSTDTIHNKKNLNLEKGFVKFSNNIYDDND